ncbi:transmembrane protein 104 isoform X5 [Anas acuta]|uniref:transmembrane protein 104 isoform X5 n=1 Tax=Anas acuta TaxID=28680 RepID=UPI0035C9199A
MAGGITDTGELYSPYVGLVYMFNLIVGTGALTMPKAFATAGWLVSLVLLMFLGFMSYMTTTFVVEAMAAANAQLRWKRMEKRKEDDEDEDSSSGVSDSDVLLQDGYERAETRPILSVQRRGSPNIFEITERVEMGQMASMFFNKVGVNLFYFCIIIYLYGDLAIYAAAVPVSLMQVTCSAIGNHSCSVGDGTKYNDTDKCWGPIRRIDAYRLYLILQPCWRRSSRRVPRRSQVRWLRPTALSVHLRGQRGDQHPSQQCNCSVHSTPGSFYLLQRAEDQVSSNRDVSDEMDRLPYFLGVLVFGCALIHIHSSTCKNHGRAALSLNHPLSQAGQVAVSACKGCSSRRKRQHLTARAGGCRGCDWTVVMRCITILLCVPLFFPLTVSFSSFSSEDAQSSRGGQMRQAVSSEPCWL